MEKNRYKKIISAIFKELQPLNHEQRNIRLLSGFGGISLFFSLYEDIYEDKKFTVESLDILMRSTSKYVETLTFCDGLSGVCFLLNYLKKKGKYTFTIDSDIDDCIKNFLFDATIVHNYEYLYGLVGIGNYLLIDSAAHQKNISAIINWLDKNKEIVDHQNRTLLRWQDKISNKTSYNLSMSHGMSGIVMFLAKLKSQHDNDPRVGTLLEGTVITSYHSK